MLKVNKVKISLMLVIFSLLSIYFDYPVKAIEKYWYKGANYDYHVTDPINGSGSVYCGGSPCSTVVVTASAVYDGKSTGKEMVRAFTREKIVANYYGAYEIYTDQVKIFFGTQNNSVYNFIGSISPNESTQYNGIGVLEWFLDGIWEAAYELAKAIVNSMNGSVKHQYDTYKRNAEITFTGVLTDTELPSSISYTKAHEYYDGKYNESTGLTTKYAESRGVAGFFSYSYILSPGNQGYLVAKAKAYYEMRIDTGSTYPLVLGTGTNYAVLNHTITGR